eukprot:5835168-Pyramimonas_sp.AAC.1
MRAVPLALAVESIWGHETLYRVGETHGARVVLGGGGRMRAVPPGPSVELPMGPRSAVLGG